MPFEAKTDVLSNTESAAQWKKKRLLRYRCRPLLQKGSSLEEPKLALFEKSGKRQPDEQTQMGYLYVYRKGKIMNDQKKNGIMWGRF